MLSQRRRPYKHNTKNDHNKKNKKPKRQDNIKRNHSSGSQHNGLFPDQYRYGGRSNIAKTKKKENGPTLVRA